MNDVYVAKMLPEGYLGEKTSDQSVKDEDSSN
ncbi:hypothetical protein VSAK1_06839 [Vibrio mediterranei AK1]|jgi:hypothetical protein|nr:hypothetical protein VSAK1_06839 [Vibrio mediterranei AK1]